MVVSESENYLNLHSDLFHFIGFIICDFWQVILAASQIVWCERIHSIFEGSGDRFAVLKDFERENFDNLNKLAEMVRGELPPLSRATLCSLITIDVHARDSVSLLVARQVVDR